MVITKNAMPRVGAKVVLVAIPPGLLDGLPDDDQRAINAIVGKPIRFCGYDDVGRAELEFDDPFNDSTHDMGRARVHPVRRQMTVVGESVIELENE